MAAVCILRRKANYIRGQSPCGCGIEICARSAKALIEVIGICVLRCDLRKVSGEECFLTTGMSLGVCV
jgi:hypothetical protein